MVIVDDPRALAHAQPTSTLHSISRTKSESMV